MSERVALYDGSLDGCARDGTGSRCRPAAARSGGHGMSIGILIADDQALVRAGFRMILEASTICGSSPRPRTATRQSRLRAAPAGHRADGHPDADGWTASRRPGGSSPRATSRHGC